MALENWLGIVGGIAMFLFGIKIMGNGIERLAGEKLKKILEKLTTNRFLGLFMGMLITGIIQSSNAVSVMTVGFVNAEATRGPFPCGRIGSERDGSPAPAGRAR